MARIAVIGAGAAGISAARTLSAAGLEAVVWEARDRIGGRVHTDTTLAGHPVELGAGFVHGARVATWEWIRATGVPVTGAAHAYEMWFHLQGRLHSRDAARDLLGADPLLAIDTLTTRWLEQGRPETSLDRVLDLWPEISPKPLTDEGRRLIANYIAELTACDLDHLGMTRARARAAAPPETQRHFRLTDGYADLIGRVAAGLRIETNAAVTRIRWDGASAEITANGAAHRYDRVIVTLPLGVLQRGTVEFVPALPAAKQAAIANLNPGHISKVILRLDKAYWPPAMTFLWTPLSTQLWWRPGQGQPHEQPVITAFFGGRDAAALDGASMTEAAAEACRQLGDILGTSLAGRVRDARFIAWGAEPYTLMGYSSRPPGTTDPRAALAAPCGALAFAGEATSPDHPATVHGAIETGRRAAAEVLRSLHTPPRSTSDATA